MKKIIRYFKESVAEMKKVVWPSRQYIGKSTVVVIVSSFVFAVFLGLVDFLLLKGLELLF
ncbi:MAG: preprotein translocase subunit SecE [Sphaerochaetaceae bacterium]|jgi:preprotein translocase subunit SecE|nr:preprotein translocase subunit SecE [Sphaerochaetaceae bacterium]MDD3163145.1 preprotein translocase subunit SecE [Sphaerochaetaceae bacterium]MDD4006418.1 preprotein translocase subunit SecE [Sphaerochaetaceae bacterium]MDD4396969.1 preprotein translocase subunit SecE [Sphaerochaetaceae bacterium]